MPSINDLFGDPDINEDDDAEIDLDKVLDSVTDILNDQGTTEPEPPATDPADEPPPAEPTATEPEGGGEEDEPEEPGRPSPEPPAAPPADPFLELPPERRAALLALDQAIMSDEDKRAQVFGILSGSSAPEQRKPEAKLPEHIDPDSFEAQLWRSQQEQRQMLDQITSATREQKEAFEKQRANTAAMQAGNAFAQRYDGKLTRDDVLAIAKHAGATGLAGALMAQNAGDPVAAFDQALEATLWGNEAWRQKVVGGDTEPTHPGDAPEAKERKRKLTALGSAASPVSGPPPKRSPAETGADGRLTERSRQDLVKELANGMARQSEGVF